MHVLSPLGDATAGLRRLARRPASLRGLRVGLLDNSKPNAGVLLEAVAAGLRRQAGAGEVRRWRKPGSAGPAPDLEGIAAAADVVLTGSAD